MSLDFDVDDEGRVTLIAEITSGRSHEDLYQLVRERHPSASRRDIVHAAFGSVIDTAYRYDYGRASLPQKFAFEARTL